MSDLPRVVWIARTAPHLTYTSARRGTDAYVRVERTKCAILDFLEPDRCETCGGIGQTLDDCGSCWSTCRACSGSRKKPEKKP